MVKKKAKLSPKKSQKNLVDIYPNRVMFLVVIIGVATIVVLAALGVSA
tara:strand:- start:300 stop:443 length:144 start_codon:yes stop_codon:yes gene_type:complete